MKNNKVIIFVDNTAHHAFGQIHLLEAYSKLGIKVIVIVPKDDKYFFELQKFGFECINIKLDPKGINPIKDLLVIYRLKKYFIQYKPFLICSFTIKCNLYSVIAAKSLNTKVIVNITGLGYVFLRGGIFRKFIIVLYRYAFKNLYYAFFQNSEDLDVFIESKIIKNLNVISLIPGDGVNTLKFNFVGYELKFKQIDIIPGSGVNLKKFPFVGYNNNKNQKFQFLYSGRLLWDKGIMELLVAYQQVKEKYPYANLVFIGNYYLSNPAAIKKSEFENLQKRFAFQYLGMVDNVGDIIADSDCIILPSYREGVPRSILEASSMGKAVIVSDAPGCKDCVVDGVTGFVCKVKDPTDLFKQMCRIIEIDNSELQQMGINGRKFVEKFFDQSIVIKKYMEISKPLLDL